MSAIELLASVVVIVRDDPRIVRCLMSLQQQSLAKQYWELLVVDNSNGPYIQALLREKLEHVDFIYLREGAAGMSNARNTGIRNARGKFVAFIDADCIAWEGWLQHLLAPLSESGVGVVGGKVVKPKSKTLWDMASRDLVIGQQEEPQYLPMYPAPYVVTANAAFPKALLVEAGGFDPQLSSGMDVDICWQISRRGFNVVSAPNAVVEHDNRCTFGEVFSQFYRYGIGHAQLFQKYRKVTGQKFLVNTYPFRQLLELAVVLPFIVLNSQQYKERLLVWALRVTENIALIFGDIRGAIKFRVPYL